MLYVINGKYYILVSGYYKEVNVVKKGNEYNVVPVERANENKIEATNVKNFSTISVLEAYKKQHGTSISSGSNMDNK